MKRPPRPAPPEAGELVYGLRAALATFAARPEEITSVQVDPSTSREADALLRWAASRELRVSRVTTRELTARCGTDLHEGLCVTTRPRRWITPNALSALLRADGLAVALDRVRNPYNVGSILRSAAFFGVDAAILGAQAPHPALAPMATRVAEGGAEQLSLCRTTDLADTLARLRAAGARVLGAEAGGDTPHAGLSYEGPSVLVVGHEREGLSPRVRALCDARVSIAGAGRVESLNVGVAAGVLLSALVDARARALKARGRTAPARSPRGP
ncbi:MAG: RNA methyltransferase [Polyangiales bacterium]